MMAQFSLNNVHKRGLKHHNFISFRDDDYHFNAHDDGSNGNNSDSEHVRKKAKNTNRVKWTTTEVKEIKKYFANFLTTKTTPGQKECEHFRKLSKSAGVNYTDESPSHC